MRLLLPTLLFLASPLGPPIFATGHNWINNPTSRATKTSTVNPCPPADLTRPAHMQVGPGQSFEVEFMTGHSYTNTYFGIIHDKDEQQLRSHGETMFERYIREAPAGASVRGPERTHVGYSKSNKGTWAGYARPLTAADSEYIARPGAFWGKHSSGTVTQYKYTDEARKHDVFVSYTNARWPWLEGVYRFRNGPSFPEEWDIVNLKIPARTGKAGRHILHYVWRGYRDCIDIDVLSPGEVATDKWGKEGKSRWRRIDHCQFENYMPTRPARTKCVGLGKTGKGAGGLNDCLKGCTAKPALDKSAHWSCSAVNVVPALNPVTTAPMFQNYSFCEDLPHGSIGIADMDPVLVEACNTNKQGLPRGQANIDKCLAGVKAAAQAPYKACRKKLVNIPWETSVYTKVEKQLETAKTPVTSGICAENDFKEWAQQEADKGDPAMVCYGIQAFQPSKQQVGDMWRVTADPTDPVFYSSCYVYGPLERTFQGTSCGAACEPKPASSIPNTAWKFADKCISCDLATEAKGSVRDVLLKVPKWRLSDTCRRCDALSDTGSTSAPLPAPPTTPTTPTVEHSIPWTKGFSGKAEDQTIAVKSGEVLKFVWSGGHNVYQMKDKAAFESCDFSGGTNLGAASPVLHTMGAATTYFACKVGSHCSIGQKLSAVLR